MAIAYTDPETTTDETPVSSEVLDECLWKKTIYEEGDHGADDIDHVPDDIL